MTVAPEHPRRPRRRRWACRLCCEVVPGLVRVDYCRGLGTVDPELMCSSCLAELREREQVGALDLRDVIWGVRVLKVVGGLGETEAAP